MNTKTSTNHESYRMSPTDTSYCDEQEAEKECEYSDGKKRRPGFPVHPRKANKSPGRFLARAKRVKELKR